VELQKQQDNHNFEFSTKALEVQANDRKDARLHIRLKNRQELIFISVLATIIAGIIFYSLYTNKDQIAIEIIKAIIYMSAGGSAGYGYARSQNRPSNNSSQ